MNIIGRCILAISTVLLTATASAGSVADTGLVTFSANTTAKAAEVNQNFTTLKEANNDNDARITANTAAISTKQNRVTGACGTGQSIASIAADGTVTCESDDNTIYDAGVGLNLLGTQFRLAAGTVSVHVAGFVQEDDDNTSATNGCKFRRAPETYGYYSGGTNCDALAAVTLPDGMTMTSFTCMAFDNAVATNAYLEFALLRLNLNTLVATDVFRTPKTSDSTNDPQTPTDSSVTQVIDNNTYAYFIRASFGLNVDLAPFAAARTLRFSGCKISYQP